MNTLSVNEGGVSKEGPRITIRPAFWQALSRFVRDGRIDLDNNLTDAASGISPGMPPAGLCRVRPWGRRLRRVSESVSLGRAA